MRISDSNSTCTINTAAQKLGVSVPTLRLYEKEGLICPIRTATHRRLYSLNDLRIVQTVRHLVHEHGLNFAGVRRLMALLPCWKIRPCNSAAYRTCKVPYITDSPCWNSGKAVARSCREDCQSCKVYKMASQIDTLNVYDLMKN
jgi:MerR family transcriptional regulator/heat shock protein HspR